MFLKSELLKSFIAHFESELAALMQSAKSAHLAATHEESRAEDRHDTFAIEASYLAAGQAARVQDLRFCLKELNDFLARGVQKENPPIDLGFLVTLQMQGKKTYSLIAKFGGGSQIVFNGLTVSLVSPRSPLGENLFGLRKGEQFSIESRNGIRNFEVLEVW